MTRFQKLIKETASNHKYAIVDKFLQKYYLNYNVRSLKEFMLTIDHYLDSFVTMLLPQTDDGIMEEFIENKLYYTPINDYPILYDNNENLQVIDICKMILHNFYVKNTNKLFETFIYEIEQQLEEG